MRRLHERAQALAGKPLQLTLGGKRVAVAVAELGLEVDVARSASSALAVGRGGSLFGNALSYLRSWLGATTRLCFSLVVRMKR